MDEPEPVGEVFYAEHEFGKEYVDPIPYKDIVNRGGNNPDGESEKIYFN